MSHSEDFGKAWDELDTKIREYLAQEYGQDINTTPIPEQAADLRLIFLGWFSRVIFG